jgi:Carbamoylphosphate synthase small subunit
MKKFTGILILDDGSEWLAQGYGFEGSTVGELCFNTAMTGYQEIISDPSYAEQIIVFTFPHIGNTGINNQDNESDQIAAKGIVTRTFPTQPSNWRSKYSLETWLKKHRIVAVHGIDTRSLTRRIREFGACKAVLQYKKDGTHDILALKKQLTLWPGIIDMGLTKKVTIKRKHFYPFQKN